MPTKRKRTDDNPLDDDPWMPFREDLEACNQLIAYFDLEALKRADPDVMYNSLESFIPLVVCRSVSFSLFY